MTFTAAAWCNLMMQFFVFCFFPFLHTDLFFTSHFSFGVCWCSSNKLVEWRQGCSSCSCCIPDLTRVHKQPAIVYTVWPICDRCWWLLLISDPPKQNEPLVYEETTPSRGNIHFSLLQPFWASRVVGMGIKIRSRICDVTKGIAIFPT